MRGCEDCEPGARNLRRRSILALVAGLAALGLAAAPAQAANPRPDTVPAIREWRGADGALRLGARTRIVVPQAHGKRLSATARVLAADLKTLIGTRPRVVVSARARPRRGDFRLALGARDGRLGREGYRLQIAGAAGVRARTAAGVFYGTRTLLQLAHAGALPAGRAVDWPRYPERGMMLDVGRKHFTVRWLERHVRELAYLKLNYLHLHLSDNQGFRVASDSHPEVVSNPHISKAQLKSLIALATRHHVTVVPEIDMPGHMEAALKAHPELQLRNALGGRSAANLDYTLPAARRFAHELVGEFLKLFPGPYWHIGADEYLLTIPVLATPVDQLPYPQLTAYAQQRFGPDATFKDGVVAFVNEIAAQVRAAGKTPRVWNDGLRGTNRVSLTKDAIVEWWTDTDGLLPEQILAAGHRIMNSGWWPTYDFGGPLARLLPQSNVGEAYERWQVSSFRGPLYLNEQIAAPSHEISPAEPRNLGAKVNVWNDDPNEETQDEIAAEIAPRLRLISQKTWLAEGAPPGYGAFVRTSAAVGHAPGY
jgi:hexosaminidase